MPCRSASRSADLSLGACTLLRDRAHDLEARVAAAERRLTELDRAVGVLERRARQLDERVAAIRVRLLRLESGRRATRPPVSFEPGLRLPAPPLRPPPPPP